MITHGPPVRLSNVVGVIVIISGIACLAAVYGFGITGRGRGVAAVLTAVILIVPGIVLLVWSLAFTASAVGRTLRWQVHLRNVGSAMLMLLIGLFFVFLAVSSFHTQPAPGHSKPAVSTTTLSR